MGRRVEPPATVAFAATAESGFGTVIRKTIFSGLSPSKVEFKNSSKAKPFSSDVMFVMLMLLTSA
jgi:hypothetical protein